MPMGLSDEAGGPHRGTRHPRYALTRWLSVAVIAIVVGMIPWTAYLAVSLPRHFDAHNWRLAWVGFDGAVIVVLAFTAWAAWFHRQILAPTAIVVATLLTCDAWFDVNTSFHTPGEVLTIVTALCANIPAALFFALLARHIMLRSAAAASAHPGAEGVVRRARDIDLGLGAPLWGDLAPPGGQPSPAPGGPGAPGADRDAPAGGAAGPSGR